MNDPAHHHLPIKLFAALLTETDIARPARRAHQPLRVGLMDAFDARQMRIVPSAVPPAARLLAPPPLGAALGPTIPLAISPVVVTLAISPIVARALLTLGPAVGLLLGCRSLLRRVAVQLL